jgi:hypothetical protein
VQVLSTASQSSSIEGLDHINHRRTNHRSWLSGLTTEEDSLSSPGLEFAGPSFHTEHVSKTDQFATKSNNRSRCLPTWLVFFGPSLEKPIVTHKV